MKIIITKKEIREKFCIPKSAEIEVIDDERSFVATKNTISIVENPKLKTSEIICLMESKFPVWCYGEENIDKEFPAPKKITMRHFLYNKEPDQDTLGLSVNEFEKKFDSNLGITLRERLLLEISYFESTGKHLDVKGATFCSGSRNSVGSVPRVYLSALGRVRVDWDSLDDSNAKYGVRRAVTL